MIALTLSELRRSLADFQPTALSDLRFDQSHETFEGKSNQQDQIREWLHQFAAAQVQRFRASNDADGNAFRILSVGCGSGILDLPLIQSLAIEKTNANHAGTIHYTGIDPNPVACDRFRAAFDRMEVDAVELSVLEETVDSYKYSQPFDLTHVVHSLYYFDDPAASLQSLIDNTAEHGEIVIFQAPKGQLNQLSDCFWQDHVKDPIWFSEELQTHLEASGLRFSQSRLNAEVDVSDCFDVNCPKGRLTFDFMVQSDCEMLSTSLRSNVLDHLSSISRHEGSRRLAPHPVDVFVIEKPAR